VKVEEFVKEIKKMHKEIKAILKKSQKKIKKYADRNRKKAKKYKVEQIRNRKMKKLIEKFVGSYKIKKIILENTVELEL